MVSPVRTIVLLGALAVCVTSIRGQAQQAPPASQQTDPAPQGSPSSSADPAQPDGPPVFRGGINFVRVDAIVTDAAGRSVTDLGPEDFEVAEDGRPQTVETFKRVDLDGGLMPGADGPPRPIRSEFDEEVEAARDDVRIFGIFLDDYHVRRESGIRASEDLARFIETQLGPSDMVGLMYPLAPLSDVRFIRDHEAIRRGLMRFLGRKYEYDPRNQYEYEYAFQPTETVERIRNQVSLSAIKALITRMGSLKEGRKALILVSEGYSNYVPPQLRSFQAGATDFDNPARGNPMVGVGSLAEERAQFSASSDLDMDLRQVYSVANRNNVAIYTVDPRGLAGSEFDVNQSVHMDLDRDVLNATVDTLRGLAEETDGRAIVGRNDLTLAMKQIVMDSSSYYLLGYSSDAAPEDGKFHEIKVRVRRPGVRVRARAGYWAVTQDDVARIEKALQPGPPDEISAALASIGVRSRSRVVRTWVGTERGDGGETRVTFVWEPVVPPAGAAARVDDRPARVTLTASGVDGTPHFRGRMAAPAAASSSLVTFDVPPGPLRLRISVENADADLLDSEQQDIEVPDLSAPGPVLGTPAVFRARTVRQLEDIKGNVDAAPTATREFSRTERLLVRAPVYAAGGPPTVVARLLNRTGESMMDLTVETSPAGIPSIELALAPLPPGEYLVEISATLGSDETHELVGFRVGG